MEAGYIGVGAIVLVMAISIAGVIFGKDVPKSTFEQEGGDSPSEQ